MVTIIRPSLCFIPNNEGYSTLLVIVLVHLYFSFSLCPNNLPFFSLSDPSSPILLSIPPLFIPPSPSLSFHCISAKPYCLSAFLSPASSVAYSMLLYNLDSFVGFS